MPLIQQGPLPKGALLEKYKQEGAKTDCYFIDIPKNISQTEYIEAFYTTPLFKIERFILTFLVRKPSTDHDAKALAKGKTTTFAAWHVEHQAQGQLLLCDYLGKTRSWLMSTALINAEGIQSTRLFFGSAVVPHHHSATGKTKIGLGFSLLGGFHHAYSKALLKAAYARLIE